MLAEEQLIEASATMICVAPAAFSERIVKSVTTIDAALAATMICGVIEGTTTK
jgi:hypothetical protein